MTTPSDELPIGTRLVSFGAGLAVTVFVFYLTVWPATAITLKGLILSALSAAAGLVFSAIVITVMEKNRRVAESNGGAGE